MFWDFNGVDVVKEGWLMFHENFEFGFWEKMR